ncbi:MAG: menaquinone biosynthesis decarboxylase, partial [Candidatus Omnitrophota bacterium]
MAYQNLGEFLDALRQSGELCEVAAEVDPQLEITEIADRMVKKEGPALFFRRVRGSSIPLAINLFGSSARMNRALGVQDAEDLAAKIEAFVNPEMPKNFIEK